MPRNLGAGRICPRCGGPLEKHHKRFCSVACGPRAKPKKLAGKIGKLGSYRHSAQSYRDNCRICGEPLTFTTHDGRLVALDLRNREPHRHPA